MSVVSLTPARRDLLLACVALALLTFPLWGASYLPPSSTYQYERVEVVPTDSTIEYVDDVPSDVPVSDEVGCSGSWEIRTCTLEGQLTNETIPTECTTTGTDPDPSTLPGGDRYGYVDLDGTLYEAVAIANESASTDDDTHRIDIGLEPASPDEALEDVAVDRNADEVSSTATEAATDGRAETSSEAEIPETPIKTGDDTYYRVYLTSSSSVSTLVSSPIDALVPYVPSGLGLYLLVGLSRRIEVSYVGEPDGD